MLIGYRTVPQAAKSCNKAEHWIRRQISAGNIMAEKVGGQLLLPEDEAKRLSEEHPLEEATHAV